jgi:hypothetical protein
MMKRSRIISQDEIFITRRTKTFFVIERGVHRPRRIWKVTGLGQPVEANKWMEKMKKEGVESTQMD